MAAPSTKSVFTTFQPTATNTESQSSSSSSSSDVDAALAEISTIEREISQLPKKKFSTKSLTLVELDNEKQDYPPDGSTESPTDMDFDFDYGDTVDDDSRKPVIKLAEDLMAWVNKDPQPLEITNNDEHHVTTAKRGHIRASQFLRGEFPKPSDKVDH